jgi:hypothetical protein
VVTGRRPGHERVFAERGCDGEQAKRDRERGGRKAALLGPQAREWQRRGGDRAEDEPGGHPGVAAADQHGQFDQRDDCGRKVGKPGPRARQGRGQPEQGGEETGRKRIIGAAQDEVTGPGEARGDGRGDEPAPFPARGDEQDGGVEQRDIKKHRQRTRFGFADDERRQEAADQTERRGWRAVSQGQDQRSGGDQHDQGRRRAAADQFEQDVAAIGRRVEDRDAGADQRLRGTWIAGQEAASPGGLARADQRQPKQGGGDHPRLRRHQLDRVADQEDTAGRERDAARPYEQPPGDGAFEPGGHDLASALRGPRFRLRSRFGRRVRRLARRRFGEDRPKRSHLPLKPGQPPRLDPFQDE